jgi:hypothetical protein
MKTLKLFWHTVKIIWGERENKNCRQKYKRIARKVQGMKG